MTTQKAPRAARAAKAPAPGPAPAPVQRNSDTQFSRVPDQAGIVGTDGGARMLSEARASIGHNRGPMMDMPPPQYFDREGNPIRRKNPSYRNEFDFEPGEIPEGWAYQWIRHTVHGDPESSEIFDMHENGWRTVPHERHKNRFAPTWLEGKACITRRGQLLVERPIGLNEEAMRQHLKESQSTIVDQHKRFGVEIPSNVRAMGMEARGGIARQTDAPSRGWSTVHDPGNTGLDGGKVRPDAMPKHELEIQQ